MRIGPYSGAGDAGLAIWRAKNSRRAQHGVASSEPVQQTQPQSQPLATTPLSQSLESIAASERVRPTQPPTSVTDVTQLYHDQFDNVRRLLKLYNTTITCSNVREDLIHELGQFYTKVEPILKAYLAVDVAKKLEVLPSTILNDLDHKVREDLKKKGHYRPESQEAEMRRLNIQWMQEAAINARLMDFMYLHGKRLATPRDKRKSINSTLLGMALSLAERSGDFPQDYYSHLLEYTTNELSK